jgi:hypothetical protein
VQPTTIPYPFKNEDIWSRTKKVSDVLSTYRAMYSPAAGSPLIGAGDPQDGTGVNIGAVGNGEADDLFGKFGGGAGSPPPPPPPPGSVAVSISPSSVSVAPGATKQFTGTVTGTSNTAVNWTATGGTITTGGLFTAGATAGTFSVTATSAQDNTKSASATVTIAVPVVSVSISPTSASLAPGTTKQFTATVTGTSNTAVNWSATGGTITTGGLYTAGATAGAFSVTATSAQDNTKSASATVTIAVPPVSVSVSPTSAVLAPAGTQQFTATVTGTSNTAVNWSATGGTITTAGLYTAGASAGAFSVTATSAQDATKSASAAVTIATISSGGHPRIILDPATLATLRSRAQAHTPEWTALKSVCDSMIGGTVEFPGGNGYPNLPSVGEGYQGSSYYDAIMALGVCYQTAKTFDPASAGNYATKGIAILAAMSDPAHYTVGGFPLQDRDDGYGIRFYGTTMGIGYDWFHDALTPALATQVQNALNTWIFGFENDAPPAFEFEHVLGNYYAGYYAAKCFAALAVQGDSPLGDTWWNDWLNVQHNQRVVPYYALNMAGGGWPEGFANYGPLSTRNMILPALAVRTAKGLDLIHAAQPFPFPLEQSRWVMQFTWPSRDFVDDRDGAHSNGSDTIWPGTPDANTYSLLAGYLSLWSDPLAPVMHKYARDAKTALAAEGAGGADEWLEFLFWDNAAPESDYSTQPTSYATTGIAEVAARSDWSNSATWMSFRTGPYINNPGAGHQAFDSGSIALTRGKSPLVVNAETWIMHNPNGDPGENAQYDDSYGNWDVDHTLGNRRFFDTFQVRHVDGSGNILDNFGQWALTRADGVRTHLAAYEDAGLYVMARGEKLEDMYRPFQTICSGVSPVSSFSRQIVYLRPTQFVVYDRTGVCNASLDQYLAFHFPAPPVNVSSLISSVRRFDVTNGAFAGAMTTVLPANAAVTITDQIAADPAVWNKVWRSEIRATGPASATHQWLTVFDLSTTSASVAAAAPLSVTSGAVTGAVLQSALGNNVVVFGTAPAGTVVSGTIAYSAPAAQSRHVITDLTPSGSYTVSVSNALGSQFVTVTSGGSMHASTNGVLSFSVTSGGVVQP